MTLGPFDAAGIRCIKSTNVTTHTTKVDGTDSITVEPPTNVTCNAWVDGDTLCIEGKSGSGPVAGITIQAGHISGPGLDGMVRVKVPRGRAGQIRIENVQN